ncbi:serine/threonine-protein kinase [Spirochaetia bacterium 38H-sp]|uniref:non-specific serine/threonine protein kinase n=1 Tax=Rarispira pelagica TaxID=3141764 RepID=A0ABU9UBM5_9SPIR
MENGEEKKYINQYQVISLLARGGMGAVYKAIHPSLKRHVVIKKLAIKQKKEIVERFKREAKILLDCKDPNIVHVHDYFVEGRSHYIVMEYIDGMSLDLLIKKRRYLSIPVAAYIFLNVCRALKYAHDNGIIHRDIKPANILLSKNGDIKLADFGIAALDTDEDEGITREGMTLGTPSYMPPEQFKDSKHVDKRADIYAMGVMLYEMLTGKKPFPGNFSPETIVLIQKGKYLSAKKINPDIPPAINRIIKKTINPNPERRFKDVSAMIKRLEKFLKKYDIEKIKKVIASYVREPAKAEIDIMPTRQISTIVASISIAIILAATGSYFLWQSGVLQKNILSSVYGGFNLVVRVPAVINNPDDLFIKANLFIDDNKDIPPAPYPYIKLDLDKEQSDTRTLVYKSKNIYISPGIYRIKLAVDSRIYWQTISLRPFSSYTEKKKTQNIIIDLMSPVPRPLTVHTKVEDAITERPISDAKIEVLHAGRWKNLAEIKEGELFTGQVYKFRAMAEGYYTENYSLLIRPGQDLLYLNARLVPIPAKLSIDGPSGITLLINGTRYIPQANRDNPWHKIDYRGGKEVLELPAGRYEIEAKKGKKAARIVLALKANDRITINIKENKNSLIINKEE